MLECDRRASLSLKELYLLQQRVGKAQELTCFSWSHRRRPVTLASGATGARFCILFRLELRVLLHTVKD
jgi:hypothetical protein